jgi:hypothetical protein
MGRGTLRALAILAVAVAVVALGRGEWLGGGLYPAAARAEGDDA